MQPHAKVGYLGALVLVGITSLVHAQSQGSRITECLTTCDIDGRDCERGAREIAESRARDDENLETQRQFIEQGLNRDRAKRGLSPQAFNPPKLFSLPSPAESLRNGLESCNVAQRRCAAQCQ